MCRGIIFGLKKEGKSDTSYNVNKPENIMLSKINKSMTKKYCIVPFMLSRAVKFIGT